MDPSTVATVKEWSSPESVKGVQTFLGFANFYWRVIQGYSEVVSAFTALIKKGIKFCWTPEAEDGFQLLKEAFTTAPVLMHFDPEKPIIVETDASDYVSAGVLSQQDDAGILHPLAFYSKKHSLAECNYEI